MQRKNKTFEVDLFGDGLASGKDYNQTDNATFYTTDTHAFLNFKPLNQGFEFTSATVNLYNRDDGSLISQNEEEGVVIENGVAVYEMQPDIIAHKGAWVAQVTFANENEKYTTGIINFDVRGNIIDDAPEKLGLVNDWNKFYNNAKEIVALIESEEATRQATFEGNEAGRQATFEQAETSREQAESVRNSQEATRQKTFEGNESTRQSTFEASESNRQSTYETAENTRKETFNELVETGVIETEIKSKLTELETNYAPKFNEVAAQLDHTVDEFNRAVSDVTVDSEVILARGEHDTLGERLDENDIINPRNKMMNIIKNGSFDSGISFWRPYSNPTYNLELDGDYLRLYLENTSAGIGQDINFKKNNVYYISVVAKASTVTNASITLATQGVSTFSSPIKLTATDTYFSLLITPDKDFNTFVIGRMTPTKTLVYLKKNPKIINLTETFGKGNEPSKLEIEELLKITGWFDGEITLSQKQLLNWQLKLIRQNRNAIIALGGTL